MKKSNNKRLTTPTIGLIGNYGWNNLGDELLLDVLYDYFLCLDYNIGVYSLNSTETMKKKKYTSVFHGGIRNFDIKTLRSLFKLDYLIFGGGGIINDYYKQTPRWLKFWWMMSRFFGFKLIFLSVGVGPISTSYGTKTYRKILKDALFISVRDKKSKEILKNLISNDKILLSSDAVFLKKKQLEKKNIVYHKTKIIISLRPWSKNNYILDIVDALSNILKEYSGILPNDTVIEMVSFEETDSLILKSLGERLSSAYPIVYITPINDKEVIEIYRSALFVIGMRFHSLVLASLFSVPFIGLNYDNKVYEITSRYMGNEYLVLFNYQLKENIKKAIFAILTTYNDMSVLNHMEEVLWTDYNAVIDSLSALSNVLGRNSV